VKKLARVLVPILMAVPSVLHAQVPGIINYQGRIVDNGTNFTGTGLFEFALINGASGTTNFWSNDGTAVGQPAASVSLTVTKGLYSVLLGDTTLSNMTVAIPASVFTNTDVRLRVWFNDGVNGFQRLSPDQRLGANGYALMAASVPAGAITSAQLASNAVTAANLAPGAVTAAAIAPGAVTAAAIANGAVGSTQLASNAISAANLVTQGVLAQGASIVRGGTSILYFGTNLFGWASALTNNDQAYLVGGTYTLTNWSVSLTGKTNTLIQGINNPRIFNYVPTTNAPSVPSPIFITVCLDGSTNCTLNGIAVTTSYGPNYPANVDAEVITAGGYGYGPLIENSDFFSLMANPTWEGQGGVFVAVNETNLVVENVTIGSLGMTNSSGTNVFFPGCGWLATHGYNTNYAFRNVTLYGMAEEVEPSSTHTDPFFTQSRAPDLGENYQPLGNNWTVGAAAQARPYFGNLTDYENKALIFAATGFWVPFPITTNNTLYPASADSANALASLSSFTVAGSATLGSALSVGSYILAPTGTVEVGQLEPHSMVLAATNLPSYLVSNVPGGNTNQVLFIDTGLGAFTATISSGSARQDSELYFVKVSPDTNVFTLDSGSPARGIGRQGEQVMFTNAEDTLLIHAARLSYPGGSNYWVILSNNMGMH